MAAKHSLAQRVLTLCDELDEALIPIRLEMAEIWPGNTHALLMSLAHLRTAALARLSMSESERSRRNNAAAASVMAQGGPCD